MNKKQKKHSTQKYLPFKEIKEGVITMKDGSYRAVLMVNSINFNLKSPDEQTALLNTFQTFLNSLDFPLQILIQSRILDLDNYLKSLEQVKITQTNELLQEQTQDYIDFLKELIGVTNIMSKTFYVIISNTDLKSSTNQSILKRLFSKPITPVGRFRETRNSLMNAANLVANNLSSMGLHCVLLNTKELIDVLYATYNPDIARRQKLFNINSVDANIIAGLANSKPNK